MPSNPEGRCEACGRSYRAGCVCFAAEPAGAMVCFECVTERAGDGEGPCPHCGSTHAPVPLATLGLP